MAVFAESENGSDFDYWSIVFMEGVVVIEAGHRDACSKWLRRHNYTIASINFSQGFDRATEALGETLGWQENFGYKFRGRPCNADALRDGFRCWKTAEKQVLEVLNADIAFREEPQFVCNLLSIARECSRQRLAIGQKFFVVQPLDCNSVLIDVQYDSVSVPPPYSTPGRSLNPFELPSE